MKLVSFSSIILAVALAATGSAQIRVHARPKVAMMLLKLPNVQSELKLTSDQTKKIPDIIQKWQDAGRIHLEGGGSQDDIEAQVQEQLDKNDESARKTLTELLEPAQLARFKQLNIQSLGLRAFDVSEVRKKLALTATQTKLQQDSIAKYDEAERNEVENMDKTPDENGVVRISFGKEAKERLRKIMLKELDALAATFSAEQKAAWAELTGPAFTF